jgi:hypothetical protein
MLASPQGARGSVQGLLHYLGSAGTTSETGA